MIEGLLGRKIGMTQIFNQRGEAIPVTVVELGPCVVTQVKTKETDGYEAVQIGYGAIRLKNINKPEQGHLRKAGRIVRYVREFGADDVNVYEVGQELTADHLFGVGSPVDVTGTSKGRGFSGVMKRHNFRGGPRTHGQSDRARAPGSIGAGTTPGHVYKGTRMAGRMGNKRVTVQNLSVVEVIGEKNVVLIRGSVPGAKNSLVMVRRAVKGEK